MALYREDIVDIELTGGNIHRSFAKHSIGSGDAAANRFGVRVFRNGEPVNLTGATCEGFFRQGNHAPIALTDFGTVSGNVAYVTLPQACYNYEGQYVLAIKLVNSSVTGTMRIVDGMVDNTGSDAAVAPTESIPTYQEILAVYEDMVEVKEGSVLFNAEQVLTNTQKARARENIDAASMAVVEDMIEDTEGVPVRNMIDDFPAANQTKYGISFSKTKSGTFHISGTVGTGSGAKEFVLFRSENAVPVNMKKGRRYMIAVSAINAFVWISAYYNNVLTPGAVTLFQSKRPMNGEQSASFVIPEDCTGLGITIRFDDADSFNEDVQIYLVEKGTISKRRALTEAVYIDEESIDSVSNITANYALTRSTVNGISAARTGDNTFSFYGTRGASTWSTFDLFRSHTELPEGIEAGKTYCLYLKSYDVGFWVIGYDGDEDETGTAIWRSRTNPRGDEMTVFTIPETGVQGISLGFKCENADEFDEEVTLIITEQKTPATREFLESVNGMVNSYQNKKLYSLGNSFLTGIVYTNGRESGRCTFKDAIYGQIAMSLGIGEEETNHIYHGNTGFISPSTTSPYIYDSHSDIICDTDMSGYDYCLTHFNGSDLRKVLGTVNADGTGTTLADAVVRVVEHIRDNKWICKLIIMGTPPYSADYAGDDIFITPQGTSGNSINDMDDLMYAMAKKYHFIYVSWQDLEISYHYMDFADYHTGDTGARHASSVDTYRALGEFAATQINAVSSPIAIKKLMSVQE